MRRANIDRGSLSMESAASADTLVTRALRTHLSSCESLSAILREKRSELVRKRKFRRKLESQFLERAVEALVRNRPVRG